MHCCYGWVGKWPEQILGFQCPTVTAAENIWTETELPWGKKGISSGAIRAGRYAETQQVCALALESTHASDLENKRARG